MRFILLLFPLGFLVAEEIEYEFDQETQDIIKEYHDRWDCASAIEYAKEWNEAYELDVGEVDAYDSNSFKE